jgi:hypothetical protein
MIDQRLVFGVAFDPRGDERAEWDDLAATGLDVVQGEPGQGRANTSSLEGFVDFGVDEDVPVPAEVINGLAHRLAVDLDDIPVIVGVVAERELDVGGLFVVDRWLLPGVRP